ncbi:hypothetical protein A6770_00175 [Nostoc minutum NIES-26]|uniref:APS kinase domain-containing protein n=2 Tax=Nostocaceae TaxID=1162 RepID=A0A367QY24_9NOSO|nr:hypothetical protein A6770_00175 [Nostoc minutum NIES-26]
MYASCGSFSATAEEAGGEMSVVAKSSRKYATPIACAVAQELKRRNYPTELLDGDVVRNHLSQGLGFSIS